MTEYYYMFSSGEYSDYCVGGMYKSKQKMDEAWFARYLKGQMIIQVPEAKEFLLPICEELSVLTGYTVPENLYVYCTGDEQPQKPFNCWYGDSAHKEYIEKNIQRSKRKTQWIEDKGFSKDFVELLVRDGILETVEYTEIWNG